VPAGGTLAAMVVSCFTTSLTTTLITSSSFTSGAAVLIAPMFALMAEATTWATLCILSKSSLTAFFCTKSSKRLTVLETPICALTADSAAATESAGFDSIWLWTRVVTGLMNSGLPAGAERTYPEPPTCAPVSLSMAVGGTSTTTGKAATSDCGTSFI
jgi:hypothetical protein